MSSHRVVLRKVKKGGFSLTADSGDRGAPKTFFASTLFQIKGVLNLLRENLDRRGVPFLVIFHNGLAAVSCRRS